MAGQAGRSSSIGPTVRPQKGATIYEVIGDDREEYVVSVPCKVDGRIGCQILVITVGSAERAAAWAAAANGEGSEPPQVSTEDVWGPWFPWSGGSSCPVPLGSFVQIEKDHHGRRCRAELRIDSVTFNSPIWRARTPLGKVPMVLRYRERTPRGMALLRSNLASPPFGFAKAPNRRPTTRTRPPEGNA